MNNEKKWNQEWLVILLLKSSCEHTGEKSLYNSNLILYNTTLLNNNTTLLNNNTTLLNVL